MRRVADQRAWDARKRATCAALCSGADWSNRWGVSSVTMQRSRRARRSERRRSRSRVGSSARIGRRTRASSARTSTERTARARLAMTAGVVRASAARAASTRASLESGVRRVRRTSARGGGRAKSGAPTAMRSHRGRGDSTKVETNTRARRWEVAPRRCGSRWAPRTIRREARPARVSSSAPSARSSPARRIRGCAWGIFDRHRLEPRGQGGHEGREQRAATVHPRENHEPHRTH